MQAYQVGRLHQFFQFDCDHEPVHREREGSTNFPPERDMREGGREGVTHKDGENKCRDDTDESQPGSHESATDNHEDRESQVVWSVTNSGYRNHWPDGLSYHNDILCGQTQVHS